VICKAIDHILVIIGVWTETDQYDPEVALSAARQILATRDQTKALFLWVHLMPPHSPYASPAPFAGRFDLSERHRTRFNSDPPSEFVASLDREFPSEYIGRYDESVEYLDDNVGSFIEWLKRAGLYEKSLIVISADHGESFSHGYGAHGGPMLYEDIIRVPLMIKEPKQTEGKRLETLSEQIDLMPTILELAGVPIEGEIEGKSLAPVLLGKKIERPIFSMNFDQNGRYHILDTGSVVMVDGRWKYCRFIGRIHYPMMPQLKDTLFDIQNDPGETKDMLRSRPDVAARMRLAIDEQLRIHGGPTN
jgi:arylsulfatase A-like enzyme